jgi:hypothetical protein
MAESKSTEKLMSMTLMLDKIIDKLNADKIDKIKLLEITWINVDENGYRIEHPLPILKLEFHQ